MLNGILLKLTNAEAVKRFFAQSFDQQCQFVQTEIVPICAKQSQAGTLQDVRSSSTSAQDISYSESSN